MKLGAKRAELVQKFVPRSRVEIFRNERTRSTPFGPKLMFWCISYHLSASSTVWLPQETRWKTGQTSAKLRTIRVHSGPFGCLTKLGGKLVQKFMPRSRVRIFRNEHTRSTPFDTKLMFWCISYLLGAFRTVWLHYETRCKTGRTSAKVRASKSRRNFSQRTHPIHPIGP